MRILVTGGGGFIGSHTAQALLPFGHHVRILDNFDGRIHQSGRPAYLPKDVEVVEGDVRDKQAWARALNRVDAVYHFAAYQDYLPDFGRFFHVNSVGTALLFEVLVEQKISVQRVVVASSQAVYGEGRYRCINARCSRLHVDYYPDIRSERQLRRGEWDHRCPNCKEPLEPQPTNELVVNAQNQYAISKYTQELIALNLGKRYGISTTVARYSITQGPRQSFFNAYSGACRIFCLSYYFGRAPNVYEDGRQLRDFVNIEDVVAANLTLLSHPSAVDGIFNVGGGRGYTVLEFAEMVRRAFGHPDPPCLTGEYRFGDTRHIVSDISRMRALGWTPTRTPEQSIRDYIAWLQQQERLEDTVRAAEQRMRVLRVLQQVDRSEVLR